MARHAPGDRVNGELHLHTPVLQQRHEVADDVLGLGSGHPIAGDDDHSPAAIHEQRHVVRRSRLYPPGIDVIGLGRGGYLCTHASEYHVSHRAVHGPAHQDGENEPGGAYQGAGNDEHAVV